MNKGEAEKIVNFDEAIISEVMRQMTANEAAWILMALPIAKQSHTVTISQIKSSDIQEKCSGEDALRSRPWRTDCVLQERRRRGDAHENSTGQGHVCSPGLHDVLEGESESQRDDFHSGFFFKVTQRTRESSLSWRSLLVFSSVLFDGSSTIEFPLVKSLS